LKDISIDKLSGREMNSSQAIEIFQKEYPITQYPIWIIFGLIIIALIIIIVKKMAERSGDDLYDYLKKKLKGATIDPAPPTPLANEETLEGCAITSSLPLRNPNFTGRKDVLADLRTALTSGQVGAWKQALTGLGGTGKSQIAAEYAYLHRGDYDFIWWLASEESAALAANFAGLASELNLPEKDSADQTAIIAAIKRWLGKKPKLAADL
jgi:hypothetical protein